MFAFLRDAVLYGTSEWELNFRTLQVIHRSREYRRVDCSRGSFLELGRMLGSHEVAGEGRARMQSALRNDAHRPFPFTDNGATPGHGYHFFRKLQLAYEPARR